jgi:hypothetical protein
MKQNIGLRNRVHARAWVHTKLWLCSSSRSASEGPKPDRFQDLDQPPPFPPRLRSILSRWTARHKARMITALRGANVWLALREPRMNPVYRAGAGCWLGLGTDFSQKLP